MMPQAKQYRFEWKYLCVNFKVFLKFIQIVFKTEVT